MPFWTALLADPLPAVVVVVVVVLLPGVGAGYGGCPGAGLAGKAAPVASGHSTPSPQDNRDARSHSMQFARVGTEVPEVWSFRC